MGSSPLLLRRLFYAAIAIKGVAGFCKLFLPLDLPHRWRQIDTLGVAVRYWLRWTEESTLVAPLLPAVLNSKDSYGITPMEFPLFNLLAAPMFFAGPEVGSVLAKALMFTLHIVLTFWCSRLWRGNNDLKSPMEFVCLCLGLITVSSSYLFKFMPDYASFILVFIAVSGAWNQNWQKRAFAFATLGLLMKPTSVIGLAFCLFHPQWKPFLRRNLAWMIAAIAVTLVYYTEGLNYIRTFQDGRNLFAVAARNPFVSLAQVFSEPIAVANLLATKLLFTPGLFLLLFVFFIVKPNSRRVLGKITGVLALQILAIMALDGNHSFVHDYYYIACSPTLAYLIFQAYAGIVESSFQWKDALVKFLMLLLVIKFFDQIQLDTRNLWPSFNQRYLSLSACQALRKRHAEIPWNEGYVFRSKDGFYPEAGVCFFEREGSTTSAYGLFSLNDKLPEGCSLLDQEGNAVLARCK